MTIIMFVELSTMARLFATCNHLLLLFLLLLLFDEFYFAFENNVIYPPVRRQQIKQFVRLCAEKV